MKVIKKSRLLPPTKPRIALANGSVDGSAVFFEIENAEAVRDYREDEIGVKMFSVDLWKNGSLVEADAEAIWIPNTAPYAPYDDFASPGDTVKVVAHVDPAKTEFYQKDGVLEFVVE